MKPHKHAELIKLWADGRQVQRYNFCAYGEWVDEKYPTWGDDIIYRLKPEKKKYRVAEFDDTSVYKTNTADNQYGEADLEARPSFVRWLTDWVEYD